MMWRPSVLRIRLAEARRRFPRLLAIAMLAALLVIVVADAGGAFAQNYKY